LIDSLFPASEFYLRS